MKIKCWRIVRNNIAGTITLFYGVAFVASVSIGESQIAYAVVTVVSLWLWHQMIEDDRIDDEFESRIKRLEEQRSTGASDE